MFHVKPRDRWRTLSSILYWSPALCAADVAAPVISHVYLSKPLFTKHLQVKPFMAHIVAIANQKGGVGKTTTAVNLAASLAIAERRTLLLDADPQGNATSGVGIAKHEVQLSLYDAMVEGQPPREVVLPAPGLPHLMVLPATQDLVGAELQLVDRQNREAALRNVVEAIESDYDYIVVDCPPSLGLLTLNVLAAAN